MDSIPGIVFELQKSKEAMIDMVYSGFREFTSISLGLVERSTSRMGFESFTIFLIVDNTIMSTWLPFDELPLEGDLFCEIFHKGRLG